MRTCKKCSVPIHSRIWIDGKEKNISERKYCFQCLPWKKHNARRLDMPARLRTQIDKAHAVQVDNRLKRKKNIIELKGGACCICGYNRIIRNLVFHHVNPKDKLFQLAQKSMTNQTEENILIELKKTVLLCHNCHGEVHDHLHEELEEKWKKEISNAENN